MQGCTLDLVPMEPIAWLGHNELKTEGENTRVSCQKGPICHA